MSLCLFTPAETRRPVSAHWYLTRDGDPEALALYEQHYSCHHYADGRRRVLFVGPGEKLVLITGDGQALFVWRRFLSGDGQEGVNCAVFRNVSRLLRSLLIEEACEVAWDRWPGARLYTYVKARAVRSPNPGYCFQMAGWSFVRDGRGKPLLTRHNRLHILERLAEVV